MSFYSKVIDIQKLNMAWEHVRKNRPACGVDDVTWEMFESGKKEYLKNLSLSLGNHTYAPKPVKMVTLYKEEKQREVALYCMADKVIQQSVASELVKIYDASFSACTFAYRPGKSALTALDWIAEKIQAESYQWVLKLDIEHFFDQIQIEGLLEKLKRQIKEEDSLELIGKLCAAPSVSEDGELRQKKCGIYQGASIAPVLSNIYLSDFDFEMERVCDFYIRYSDDMIVLAKDQEKLQAIQAKAALLLEQAGLSLHPSKTVLLPIRQGFSFLGYSFDHTGKAIPAKAEAGLEKRLEMLWIGERAMPLQEKLRKGAEILGGWEQYFREERKAASIYEFAVLANILQNKHMEMLELEEWRKGLENKNREICVYLYQFWREKENWRMMLYEMEDYCGVAAIDTEKQWDACPEELLGWYEKYLEEETEECLSGIMQVYADFGQFQKAGEFMGKISILHEREAEGKGIVAIRPSLMKEEMEVALTPEQRKVYMETFLGREDTYVVMEMDEYRHLGYRQVLEPLTEEVVKRHFQGECTVGTYVQRNNGTASFWVIDVDVSKKILLKFGEDAEGMHAYMQKAALQVQKIQQELKKLGLCGWIEWSGYRGYHIWVLFTEWIAVRYLNILQDILEERIGELEEGITIEFFPNKTKTKPGKMGQAIKLPYGYHAKTGKQSCFLDENFEPMHEAGRFLMNLGKYTGLAIKKVINAVGPSKRVQAKDNVVEEDISAFGTLPENVRLILERCNLMRYLCQKARTTGYLSHFERLSILYVFGHVGEDGAAFVHKVMEFTLNYQYAVTEKFIARIPAKPISCVKLRDQYQKVTAEYGCSCNFNRMKNCYPSPVLHAIKAGESAEKSVTVPTSRTLSKEKESKVYEELNINKRVQDLAGKILEMKKQKRGIDKNIAKLEHELEIIFNEAGTDCLEIEIGLLVRRKRENGYEWVVEI